MKDVTSIRPSLILAITLKRASLSTNKSRFAMLSFKVLDSCEETTICGIVGITNLWVVAPAWE